MPRYYFHMLEQDERRPDPDGVELPDDTAAVDEATKAARDFIVEAIMTGNIVDGQIIEIVDQTDAKCSVYRSDPSCVLSRAAGSMLMRFMSPVSRNA